MIFILEIHSVAFGLGWDFCNQHVQKWNARRRCDMKTLRQDSTTKHKISYKLNLFFWICWFLAIPQLGVRGSTKSYQPRNVQCTLGSTLVSSNAETLGFFRRRRTSKMHWFAGRRHLLLWTRTPTRLEQKDQAPPVEKVPIWRRHSGKVALCYLDKDDSAIWLGQIGSEFLDGRSAYSFSFCFTLNDTSN